MTRTLTAIVYWEEDVYVAEWKEVELAKEKLLKRRSLISKKQLNFTYYCKGTTLLYPYLCTSSI